MFVCFADLHRDGGGDFAGLRGGGAAQTQKRVKLGHNSSSSLCLYIKKLYRTDLFCKYTDNLHCKSIDLSL